MGRRDRRHARPGRGARAFRWVPVVLVLALLAAAGAAYRFDLGERWLGTGPDPAEEPAAVEPPDGLDLPELTTPGLVAATTGGAAVPAVSARKVRRAVAPLLDDDALGSHVVAAVGALTGQPDEVAFTTGDGPAIPASAMKVVTGAAALAALGPDHTFATTVVGQGRRITLVGGGDPFLASTPRRGAWPARADVVTLARTTAAALKAERRTTVRLTYDTSLFSGPAVNPHWPATYVPEDVVAPITSLWVDAGSDGTPYGRVDDPAATAADAFAGALAAAGIEVRGDVTRGRARTGDAELARVTSAPLAQIVEKVLLVSDNEAAEALSRHVGLATMGTGSWRAGSRGVVRTLGALGVDLSADDVHDGSGLARDNLLTAETLLAVLRLAADDAHPDLRAVLSGLPVAGFSGSLAFRFTDDNLPARGWVRAKTGTLSGVSALAGVAVDRDGTPLAFVVLADEVDLVDTDEARAALDDIASALAACRCAV